MYSILIVDDNSEILEANAAHFAASDFSVFSADTGIKALALLNERHFDCIVLDVMLPDLDGFTICKAARTITDTPIIFLTRIDEIDDKVKGLVSGGDDYLTKPHSLKELSARVLSLIRRNQIKLKQPDADFYIDHDNKMIHTKEKNVFLSPTEYDLFMMFYENPAITFSKEEIAKRIWWKNKPASGIVRVYVSKLRRKLSFAEKYMGRIENSYRNGYQFISLK